MTNQNVSFESNEDTSGKEKREYANNSADNPAASRENYLLIASTNLLSWIIALRSSSLEPSLDKLRNILSEEIKKFDSHIQNAGYDTHTFLAARYCLFTAIDEAIFSTSWGNTCGWAEDNLLSAYYKETSGGERFFVILDAMGDKPEKNIDLLELLYVILSLGFKGKLYDKGKVVMEATQYQLFQKISPFLVNAHTSLCFFMQKHQIAKKKNISLPVWFSFCSFFALFFITESIFEYNTCKLEEPVLNILEDLQK